MADVEPFHVPLRALGDHLAQVKDVLQRIVDPAVEIKLGLDQLETKVVAGIEGKGLETTARNRGRFRIRVAPMVALNDGLWAWLGYQEEWSRSPGGGPPRVFFRSSSVSIFFGFRELDPKPQIFRAEWAGYDFKGGKYRFQGGDAGHPHWQFDALESLYSDEDVGRANELLAILREEAGGSVARDFSPAGLGLLTADVNGIVSSKKVAAIHFASAGHWWRDPMHAHVPRNVMDIRVWLRRTLDYIVQELDRV